MSWIEYNNQFSPLSLQMHNLPASNATHLPSSCDEELVDESDEPPDSNRIYSQNHGFSKHMIHHTPPAQSLLTQALLASPNLVPADRGSYMPPRGYSSASMSSNESAAELTDGFTSPSRANTPSPPPPLFLAGIHSILQSPRTKAMMNGPPKRIGFASPKQEVVEPMPKKRITFACSGSQQLPRRPSDDDQKSATEALKPGPTKSDAPLKRSLTFVCTQTERKTQSRPIRHVEKAPPSMAAAAKPVVSESIAIKGRPFYDSEGFADSWTHHPFDKSRLLRVDDLLKKEREIRRICGEVEAEALQEQEEEDEEDAAAAGIPSLRDGSDMDEDDDDEDEDEDEEDDEEDEDEDNEDDDDEDEDDEEEYVYGNESGNETDNEEGFASGDDSDDDLLFYGPHPPHAIIEIPQPLCSRSTPDNSMNSPKRGFTAPRRIRSPTPELPDSTDFVCGTLDEDKEIEQAYVSCLEERKRSKHKPTPQDIDPSFPTSDLEDSDNEEPRQKELPVSRRGSRSEDAGPRGRKHSETTIKLGVSPRVRVHSPAPVKRVVASRGASPAPRRARALSPHPLRRNSRAQFNTTRPVVRTRSLPRTAGCARRAGKSSRVTSAATSPQKAITRPMIIRGAMDIVKGLEKKRERRKARLARGTKAPRGDSWRSGEGVEKMRQLGLEICGKGKARQAQWVISA